MVHLAKPIMAVLLLVRASKQPQLTTEKNSILLYWDPLIITIFFLGALPTKMR